MKCSTNKRCNSTRHQISQCHQKASQVLFQTTHHSGVQHSYLFQSKSHDSSSCGIINPEWLYQVTANCTKPITFVSVRGSCTNPWSGFGFASGSRQVKGFNMPKAHYDGHPFNYKTSILTKTTSTYESVYYDCPRSVKIWI